MTCINTGNAWVRVRNGARQRARHALPDWLSLHFSLLAVYLGGEISSLKLGLGLCSFSRRWLLHASIDNRIDLLRNFEFDRTGGWNEREVWPIDRHPIVRSLLTMVDLLDPLFKAGFVWITQISLLLAWDLKPVELLQRTCSLREREDRRLLSWQALIEATATATVNCFLKAKRAFRGLART